MKPVDPRLLRYARASRRFLVASVLLGLAGAGLVVAQAVLIAEIVVSSFQGGAPAAELTRPLLLLAAVAAGRATVSWLTELAAHRASAAAKSQLRARLLDHAARLGPSWPTRLPPPPLQGSASRPLISQRTGELTTLTTRGIDALDDYFARYLPQLALAVVVPAAVLARIVTDDWISALTIALTLPLIPVFMVLIGWVTQARTDRQWRTLSRLSGHFLDVVAGLPTLKVFGRAKAQAESIRRITADYRRATLKTLRIAFLSSFALELLATISVALVAVGIGMRLVHGELDLYTGLVVLVLAPEAYVPLRQVGAQYHAAAEGMAAAEVVFGVLETPLPETGDIPAPDLSADFSPGSARAPAAISVEELTVRHPGRTAPSLPETSLVVEPGETVAVTGPSGAGKSTLLHALLGFAAPSSGRVRIGPHDLRDLDPATWHAQISWVPQRPCLFAGTIADNVRLARPGATDDQLRTALRDAGLLPFVQTLPHGTDTAVGEGGTGLSAGQRQRIALARAFLADRPLLLLDEPTANLDGETEAGIVDAVRRLAEGRTVLLVVHRPALLAIADRTVALPAPREGGTEPSGARPLAPRAVPGGLAPAVRAASGPAGRNEVSVRADGLRPPATSATASYTDRTAAAGHSSSSGGAARADRPDAAAPAGRTGQDSTTYAGQPGLLGGHAQMERAARADRPDAVPAERADAAAPAGRTGRLGGVTRAGRRGHEGGPAPDGHATLTADCPRRDGAADAVRTGPSHGPVDGPPSAVRAAPGAPGVVAGLLRGPLRLRFALAALLGSLALASAVGLMATSGYLISRASEQPPVLYLMVAVTATRAFGIGRAVFRYAERLVAHDATFRVLADLRVAVYRRLERLAPAGLGAARRGDLLSRLVADVDSLQDRILRWLLPAAAAVTVGAAAAGLVAWLLPEAGLILALGLLTAGALVPGLSSALSRRTERRLAPTRGELSTNVVDLLTGTAELTVAGALPRALAEARESDTALTRLAARSSAAAGLGAGLASLVTGLTVAACALAGVQAVHAGRLDGVLLAVVVLTPLAAFEAVTGMPLAAQYRERSRRAAERVNEILDAPEPVREPAHPAALPAVTSPVRVRGLTARHPGQAVPALVDVDLDLAPGRRVAVVGPSGSGKTTLAQVLLRFLDPEDGAVTLGGVDTRTLDGDDVRRVIGLCAQDAHAFDSSLRENLRLARPGSGDADLRGALASARLLDWVDTLPEGLDTLVGEHGARLSGGQRQRLALARAVLADFPVLVLDEPAEYLDLPTADALTADLLAATEGRTTLLITHRLAGLEGAVDEIVVLDGGRVAQRGTWEELSRAEGPFRLMLGREERADLLVAG